MKTIFHPTRERLEISFTGGIPSARLRQDLKKFGFWWDSKNLVWHLANPHGTIEGGRYVSGWDRSLDFALRTTGQQADRASILAAREAASHCAGARGMEDACGING